MAIFVNTDAVVTVNSVDLSNWVRSISFDEESDTVDYVAMGDTSMNVKPTFKRGSVTIEFFVDFAASASYATVKGLLNTATTVAYKPTSAATSATNPERSGSFVVTKIPVVDSAVGDVSTVSVTWPLDGAITEAVM